MDSGFIDKDFNLTREVLISMLNERFAAIDYEQAKQDVIPFIKDKTKLDIWSTEFFTEIMLIVLKMQRALHILLLTMISYIKH